MDEYEIRIESDAPPGEYVLEVGMYNAATGERLPVYDQEGQQLAEDRVLLGQVKVRE